MWYTIYSKGVDYMSLIEWFMMCIVEALTGERRENE
jgi:hypothetical protein